MTAPVVAAWWPTVDQVAAILRARTQDDRMEELGTFGPTTRPTAVQVEELIELASNAFATECRVEPCEASNLQGVAGHLALTVALLVEISYFPEQVSTPRSPYEQLKDLWDGQHSIVVESVQFACLTDSGGEVPDGGGSGGGGIIPLPTWSYPPLGPMAEPRAPGAEYQVAWEGWIGRAGRWNAELWTKVLEIRQGQG